MLKVWKDTAASEARINSLESLSKKKIGLREIEQFSLGLRYNFKSEKLQRGHERPVEGVVQAAMQVKVRDERENKRELDRKKEDLRKKLTRIYHPQNKNYKKIMQYLKQEAWIERKKLTEKNREKVRHLETQYRRGEEEGREIPAGMESLSILSIFSEEKFDAIKTNEVKVPVIGNIETTEDERSILAKHPKFAIPERLLEHTLKEEQEKA